MSEYRCTRKKPYEKGSAGYKDTSARVGYFIEAESKEQALEQMKKRFPDDIRYGFDVELWKE